MSKTITLGIRVPPSTSRRAYPAHPWTALSFKAARYTRRPRQFLAYLSHRASAQLKLPTTQFHTTYFSVGLYNRYSSRFPEVLTVPTHWVSVLVCSAGKIVECWDKFLSFFYRDGPPLGQEGLI